MLEGDDSSDSESVTAAEEATMQSVASATKLELDQTKDAADNEDTQDFIGRHKRRADLQEKQRSAG